MFKILSFELPVVTAGCSDVTAAGKIVDFMTVDFTPVAPSVTMFNTVLESIEMCLLVVTCVPVRSPSAAVGLPVVEVGIHT